MMRKRYTGVVLALLVACSSSSSSGPRRDAATPDAGSGDAGVKDSGVPMTKGKGDVLGKVFDADGHELGEVEVSVAGKSGKTDNRGIFRVKDVPSGPQQVAVVGGKRSRAQVSVEVRDKGVAQVSLTSIEYKTLQLPDAKAGGVLMQDGLTIKMPPKALMDKKGKLVTGQVEARYALVNEPKTLRAAPGGMKAEVGGKLVQLESYGMVDVGFYKSEQKLVFKGEADVALPLGLNNLKQGQEIDVWSFDEAKGAWKKEGKAKIDKGVGVNGTANLKASHFSWWTIAEPLVPTCIKGSLLTETGAPVADVLLNGSGLDYLGNFNVATSSDGAFCMDVKPGANTALSAFGTLSDSYFNWSQETGALGSGQASCGEDMGGCLDLGQLSGSALFAECTGNVTSDQNHVLVLSSDDTVLDTQVQTLLQSYGNTVTIGPNYYSFDGTTSLDAYDVVYLQANNNWDFGDMPLAGQRALINWVNCGGGLLTSEWTVWKSGSNQFQLLGTVYPMIQRINYSSLPTVTYTQIGTDPVVHNGISSPFTFPADSYNGTEVELTARPGATIFFDSDYATQDGLDSSGVVGWDFNLGRVVSVSTCAGPQSLADPNYGRMMGNIVDWLQRDPANEPTGP